MKTTFMRGGCDTFAKWRNLKSERLSSTSVRKECLPRKFMKTSSKSLGKESPSYCTVKKWTAEFKSGRESVEDDGRSGQPKDSTIDENAKVVYTLIYMCDRRRDLRSIVRKVGISFGAVQSILTDNLGMPKVPTRWVP